ncbi:pilin [Nocardiopsis coralli]|uniref:pilin n=1 Tax=Nocardiopsis coralli TaxID=2772213 RepID=UPI001F47A701|nr:pilin [Nocardiopsis coralli]
MSVRTQETHPLLRVLVVLAIAYAALVTSAELWPALASEAEEPGVDDLDQVITNIRNWLVGLLVALATLFLTIGGVRYLLAGGDPGEVGKAKDTLKYAAMGYGIAILAPILVEILRGFLGME